MNTSASTRSGRRSAIFRTAASPLPTAITSIPWSFRARPTIFWMLLLSSATKILATERPPGDAATVPHTIAQLYWSIRGKTRQREVEACVSEGEYRVSKGLPESHEGRSTPAARKPLRQCRGKRKRGGKPASPRLRTSQNSPALPGNDFPQALLFLAT